MCINNIITKKWQKMPRNVISWQKMAKFGNEVWFLHGIFKNVSQHNFCVLEILF
jgi:hypothetical protein